MFGGRSERYGKVTLTIGDTKVTERTHRLSYMLFCGPIAAGLFVCHKCDTPGCVRPDHLFLGTAADNAKDMRAKGRSLCGEKNHRHARPEIRQRGERVGSAKLTEEQVRDIVRRVEAGESQADLSREYGVSSGAVSLIVQRKNWGHLWGLPIAAKPRFKGRS